MKCSTLQCISMLHYGVNQNSACNVAMRCYGAIHCNVVECSLEEGWSHLASMIYLTRQTEQQAHHSHCSHFSDWFTCTCTNTDTNKGTNTYGNIHTNMKLYDQADWAASTPLHWLGLRLALFTFFRLVHMYIVCTNTDTNKDANMNWNINTKILNIGQMTYFGTKTGSFAEQLCVQYKDFCESPG